MVKPRAILALVLAALLVLGTAFCVVAQDQDNEDAVTEGIGQDGRLL
jgi:hypothetical protein